MNVQACLDRIESFPIASLDALVRNEPFVILAPHPDDEALGCGGLIATAVDAGRDVAVIVLTDGTRSHPNSKLYPAPRLKALRREEVRAAMSALGLPFERVTFLDVEDTKAPCEGAEFEALADELSRILQQRSATTLFVTWRNDPHCDHEAAAHLADAVAAKRTGLRLWHYPIWGLHRQRDDALPGSLPAGVRLDISGVEERKRSALSCYASQMTTLIDDDPEGFHFTDETLAPFLVPYERFIEVQS